MTKKGEILKSEFFRRDGEEVAKDLLGKYLVRKINGKECRLVINEVELYSGERDEACHANKGRTKRTEVMYWDGGVWYVYLVYGMYNMLNIVVGPKDYPEAVLIRGAGSHDGPGKLTRDLKIDREFNKQLAVKESGLWIENSELKISDSEIESLPRIGIDYAGEPWKSKRWRFRTNVSTS